MIAPTRLRLLMSALLVTSYSIAATDSDDIEKSVHVLIYETFAKNGTDASILQQQIDGQISGIQTTLFGSGNTFQGYGDKFISVLPILKEMKNSNSLVVITDSRDVLVNNPYNNHSDSMFSNVFADEIKMTFEELTYNYNSSIVISAEAQCCVSALTHVKPGSYFNTDGTRNQLACSSGQADCLWNDSTIATSWELYMKELMINRTSHDIHVYDDMYLNAGLIIGHVPDLIRILEAIQIQQSEDDQAVLTDYMFHHPEDIILDYQQKIFGNNRAGVVTLSKDDRCTFTNIEEGTSTTTGSNNNNNNRLRHTQTGTTPFFIHSPGGFYECHDTLLQKLNVPTGSIDVTQRQLWKREKKCNYGTTLLNALCEERSDPQTPTTTTTTTTTKPTTAPKSALMELLGP